MLKDGNIDLVYISTITSLHYKHVKMCLENNNHVIVEKLFTTNYKDSNELVKIACSKNYI